MQRVSKLQEIFVNHVSFRGCQTGTLSEWAPWIRICTWIKQSSHKNIIQENHFQFVSCAPHSIISTWMSYVKVRKYKAREIDCLTSFVYLNYIGQILTILWNDYKTVKLLCETRQEVNIFFCKSIAVVIVSTRHSYTYARAFRAFRSNSGNPTSQLANSPETVRYPQIIRMTSTVWDATSLASRRSSATHIGAS